MPSQIESQDVAPVVKMPLLVLDAQVLSKVSGAGPHGGWAFPVEAAGTFQAALTSSPLSGPHGGW